MSAQGSIFQQNKWNGGYSDDEFFGQANSFWRSKGLEIRKNPRILQIQKAIEELSAGNITFKPICYAVLSTGEKLIAGQSGSDGAIFYSANGSMTWTSAYTHSGVGQIQGLAEYNGYVYWVTANSTPKLHRTALSDASSFSSPTLNYKTLSTNTHTKHVPMIEAFNKLYIGMENNLDELDSAGTLTAAKLVINSTFDITNITFNGSTIKLWTRTENANSNKGMLYFWNGISDSYNNSTPLAGIFHCATTVDGLTDYFIAGVDPYLYRLEGLSIIPEIKIPTRDSSYTDGLPNLVDIPATAMTNRNGIVYFGTGVKTNIGGTGEHYIEKGVWSWGRLNKNYAWSLSLEWASADYSNKLFEVLCLFEAEGRIHTIGRTSAPTYHAFIDSLDTYNDTGEVETRIFDANAAWQVYNTLRMFLAFYPLASGEKIEVFARQNLESSYGSAIMTVDYSDSADQGVTRKSFTDAFEEQEYSQIQYKIKLTAGDDNESTPKLIDFATLFETTLQD